jgi:hypothetical protein
MQSPVPMMRKKEMSKLQHDTYLGLVGSMFTHKIESFQITKALKQFDDLVLGKMKR